MISGKMCLILHALDSLMPPNERWQVSLDWNSLAFIDNEE